MNTQIYRLLLSAAAAGMVLLTALTACAPPVPADGAPAAAVPVISSPEVHPSDTPHATGTATGVWSSFQESTPFAYTTPLPEPVPGELDGLYVKLDESPPQWWKCLRCADYRAAGGIWKLQFDRGIMRIFYDVTGWRSLASYTVEQDRLLLFNDPHCPDVVAEYRWKVEDGQLSLAAVGDACAFDLRTKNLTRQSWSACQAQDEAASSPPGCREPVDVPAPETQPDPRLVVTVHGGDGRFFDRPPDLMVFANTEDRPSPEGVEITYDNGTIGYGLHRILWWNGNWIEATTDLPFTAMGVQILGEPLIGWARVLFDGEEVWRGNTSEIWTRSGRSGGYIQVSGFEPGRHVLRVESLDFDHRPVTFMGFGFSYEEGVQALAVPK